ncbi:MAG: HAD family hydrolase [Chloroflexi bacterium]|nr:HAD family hydrolase [Chloroflexota bacterium]
MRGVLFDYGHTLVDWSWDATLDTLGEVYQEHRRYLEQFGMARLPPADELKQAVALRMFEDMNASYAREELEERDWLAVFNACLRDAGVVLPPDAFAELARREHAAFCRSAILPDGTLDVLEELRSRGLKLALVSNMDLVADLLVRESPIRELHPLIPVKVYSSSVGVRKPHARIYAAALAGVGLAPEDVLFVGDRVKEDVRAPRALGMRTALSHQFRQEDDAQGEAHHRIATLRDVLRVLDEAE